MEFFLSCNKQNFLVETRARKATNGLLQLLLWAQVVGVSALLLTAVGGARMQTSVALTANHFVAVVFLGQNTQRWFNDTTTKTENQMESRLLLDVVIAERATIFKLLASEDQTLLIWRNSFLVLNFSLDIFDRVRWLDLKGDGLAGEGLHEDLHL
jgi:hypothetical protein